MAANPLATALTGKPATATALNLAAPLAAAQSGYATPQPPPAAPVTRTIASAIAPPKVPTVPTATGPKVAKAPAGPNLIGNYTALGAKEKAQAAGPTGQVPTSAGGAAPHGIVAAARTMLGVPYVFGGTDPKKALDCSAFVQAAYAKIGISIPRTTYAQYAAGTPVALNKLQPGDAVYVEPEKNGPGHVGMYIGNGQIQESPHTGSRNQIVPLNVFLKDGYVGSRRF